MDDFSGFPQHTTSSLNDAHNDTGRVAFCGPYVLSAITGYPISKVEDGSTPYRDLPPDLRNPGQGVPMPTRSKAALAVYGYTMELKESFMHLERKKRPTRLDLDAEAA